MLSFQKSNLDLRLLSQLSVIVLMLSVPVFVFLSQQKTQTQQFASTQTVQANVCGSVCGPTTSCGSPVTVKGQILDQNKKGVPGVSVLIYTHNRGSVTTSGATTTVKTDQNGNYVSNGFLCGGLNVNTGDNYAVRPDWGNCPNGSCSGASPASYEGNQINKPGVSDCAASGCNFTVKYTPNSSSSSSSNTSKSSSSSNSANSSSSTGSSSSNSSSSSANGGGAPSLTVTVLQNCQGSATKCVKIQAGSSNDPSIVLSWTVKTNGTIVTCPDPTVSGCSAIFIDGSESGVASGDIKPGQSTEVGFHLSCPATPTASDVAQAGFGFDYGGNTTIFPGKVVTMYCNSTATTIADGTLSTAFAITGYVKNPVSATKDFTLLLTPVSNPQATPITLSGVGNYNANTGLFTSIIPTDSIPSGKYNIRLHIDGALDAHLVQPNSDDSFAVPNMLISKPVNVTTGDVSPGTTGDNFIDVIDYNKLIGCMGKSPVALCKTSDLNGDGIIDENDIELLMQNFGDLGFSFAAPQFSCSLDPNCNSGQSTMQMCSLICTKTN